MSGCCRLLHFHLYPFPFFYHPKVLNSQGVRKIGLEKSQEFNCMGRAISEETVLTMKNVARQKMHENIRELIICFSPCSLILLLILCAAFLCVKTGNFASRN